MKAGGREKYIKHTKTKQKANFASMLWKTIYCSTKTKKCKWSVSANLRVLEDVIYHHIKCAQPVYNSILDKKIVRITGVRRLYPYLNSNIRRIVNHL